MATRSNEPELQKSKTRSTSMIEKVSASHVFKVEDYSLHKGIGVGKFVTSATFTVGGYDWYIRYYPDRGTEDDKGYIAFFLMLNSDISTDVKVQVTYSFTMLCEKGSPTMSQTSQTTFHRKARGWGNQRFVKRDTFETSNYLNNDSFELMCTVTVILKQCLVESLKFEPVTVPSSNLGEQLCLLLESDKGADVTFEVNGEFIKAHKLVLAARSPVFSAQFFGLMNEKAAENIKLDDIEPQIFRILLHFIYSDSVPKLDGDKMEKLILYQHLLVIADRYEVERLKLICEDELSRNMEVKILAAFLTLAEQHNCSGLKTSCLSFVSSREILMEVLKGDGYEHMARSCPNLLLELFENLRNNN